MKATRTTPTDPSAWNAPAPSVPVLELTSDTARALYQNRMRADFEAWEAEEREKQARMAERKAIRMAKRSETQKRVMAERFKKPKTVPLEMAEPEEIGEEW